MNDTPPTYRKILERPEVQAEMRALVALLTASGSVRMPRPDRRDLRAPTGKRELARSGASGSGSGPGSGPEPLGGRQDASKKAPGLGNEASD